MKSIALLLLVSLWTTFEPKFLLR